MEKLVKAKDLRDKVNLKQIPKQVGFYKWYANEEITKKLLGDYFEGIKPYLTKGENELKDYFLVYVGIATKATIKSRFDWHINQKHTFSNVKNGTLSTLRQTISSLVSQNKADEVATNDIIDKMYIEYVTFDYEIKSQEANDKVKSIEKSEINGKHIPLNIQGNKSEVIKSFKKYLKAQRKLGKENGIKQLSK